MYVVFVSGEWSAVGSHLDFRRAPLDALYVVVCVPFEVILWPPMCVHSIILLYWLVLMDTHLLQLYEAVVSLSELIVDLLCSLIVRFECGHGSGINQCGLFIVFSIMSQNWFDESLKLELYACICMGFAIGLNIPFYTFTFAMPFGLIYVTNYVNLFNFRFGCAVLSSPPLYGCSYETCLISAFEPRTYLNIFQLPGCSSEDLTQSFKSQCCASELPHMAFTSWGFLLWILSFFITQHRKHPLNETNIYLKWCSLDSSWFLAA